MYPFERFSQDAKAVLTLAQEEAEREQHSYIGTEHVLLALIRDPDQSATRILQELGISANSVEQALACWLRPGPRAARIDPDALAALGIDFEVVRERLEPGRSRSPPACFRATNSYSRSRIACWTIFPIRAPGCGSWYNS